MTFARDITEYLERREAEKAANLRGLAIPAKSLRQSTYKATSAEPAPKQGVIRSEAYRRLVAALPCWLCGLEGMTQAAHADEGKGVGIKSDDRTCYPLCVACHSKVGSSGVLSRRERRELEQQAGRETRAAIQSTGRWPKGLPEYTEKENA